MGKDVFKDSIELELKKYKVKEDELLNLKYTKPLKKDKTVNIFGEEVRLTNSNYGYSYIQNILKHKNEYVELMVKNTGEYDLSLGYTKYEFDNFFKEISKYCYILIYAFLDSNKKAKQEKVVDFTNELM